MDDMIKEKLALKEQVDSLEQNLFKQIKENESLLQTFIVFKNESKEKENKYMENKIDLEKKIKELDNIIFKVGQSAQTMHMLTKPQVFYDNIHKQALGYQNPFYLKKALRIKPTLYDGIVISDKHVAMPVIDDEETLILEEESRSKMSKKEKDPEAIKQNISNKPIDYEKLNRLFEYFGKLEAPSELTKVSLVNASLKKLKFHIAQFDSMVKKRTTPDARIEAQLQDKDTTICKLKEIIKSLREKSKEENVNSDKCEIATINVELENSVAQTTFGKQLFVKKLISETDPLAPKVLQNRDAHIDYLKHTQEEVDILWGIVEKAKAKQPLDNALDFACKHAKKIQELLFICALMRINLVESSKTLDSNIPVLSSIGLKCSTSNCGSKPIGNKKNDRISESPSRNMKNKVEAQPRKVNKKNRVVKPICDANLKHSMLNANFELICATCKKSMFDGVHDMCLLDFVKNLNSHAKSAKKHKKQNI
ncbi:hypothetical protein Tco_1305713 [Tanacetum coccineum]